MRCNEVDIRACAENLETEIVTNIVQTQLAPNRLNAVDLNWMRVRPRSFHSHVQQQVALP
jgi:hypothetical protein